MLDPHVVSLGPGHGWAGWIRAVGGLGLLALLGTLALAVLSRLRGRAEDFPAGVNPYL